MTTIRYRPIPSLPRLAWLAVIAPDGRSIDVYHGSAVECREQWMVEGVWDGDFAKGEFHRSDHFFGSGIRVDDDGIWIVPSTALVDRVFSCWHRGSLLASNSCVVLLGFTGATLDPHHDYGLECHAIRRGVTRYDPTFRVLHREIPSFQQHFYRRLLVTGDGVRQVAPPPDPVLTSFEHYHALLVAALRRIRDNYMSGERRTPVAAFATISAGYDSPAVAAVARELGVHTAFTSWRSNTHVPRWLSPAAAIDDGKRIAEAMGLRAWYLDRPRPRITEDELFFLAASTPPLALVFHAMARHIENLPGVAIVFTGFQGDYVWDARPEPKYLNEEMTGNDTAGLGLTEIRLKSGIINLAVPFMYARRIADLATISAGPAMAPWRIGGDYDRPIPRRLAESAGVPRPWFGLKKKAVVITYAYPIHRGLRRDFGEYVRRHFGYHPAFVVWHALVNKVAFVVVRTVHVIRRRLTGRAPRTPQMFFWKDFDPSRLMYVWAVETLAGRLRTILRGHGVALEEVTDSSAATTPAFATSTVEGRNQWNSATA